MAKTASSTKKKTSSATKTVASRSKTKATASKARRAKAPVKKAPAKKVVAKKVVSKKATTRKPVVRKTAAKKASPVAKKTVARKAASKTTTAKKAVARKASASKKAKKTLVSLENEQFTFRHYKDVNATHEDLGLSEKDVMDMYTSMVLQRRFEERAAQMYGQQKIGGFLHLYIGQEAVSTGSAWATTRQDAFITAYRDHGIGLALGMTANECMAELFGKVDGCSKGKGGSMHYFDKKNNFLGGHGIVGGQIPLGVGASFAQKYKGTDNVTLTYFGDGAIQQGAFHEAANLAGLYKLPSILICENNLYGMGTSVERSSAVTDLYKRAVAYNMHGAVCDGMDVFVVYQAIKELKELASQGQPCLLEMRTYRYRGHSMSDPQKYRTKEEMDERKGEDPILQLKSYILGRKIASLKTLDKIDDDAKEEVLESVKFADASEMPSEDAMYENVYADDNFPFLR